MAVTACAPFPGSLRTVPRKRQVPPHSGAATSWSSSSTLRRIRVRYVIRPTVRPSDRPSQSSSRQRRQQRHFIPVRHGGLQARVPQVHGHERPCRKRGGGEVLPNPPQDVRHGRRNRKRDLRLLPSHQLRVAREEAHPHRADLRRRGHCFQYSPDHFPVVPDAIPRQIRAAFGVAEEPREIESWVNVRSRTSPFSVSGRPSRITRIGSADPTRPRYRARNSPAHPVPDTSMSPTLRSTSPGSTPAASAGLPATTSWTTTSPAESTPELMPRNTLAMVRRSTANPALGSSES